MNDFGLTAQQSTILITLFAEYLPQGKVLVYGSRAIGTFTERSDIDLVIVGAGSMDRHRLADIQDLIIESDFPYLCDLHYVETITNPQLLAHIQQVGQVFYECPE